MYKQTPFIFETDSPNSKCCKTVSGADVNKSCIFPFVTTNFATFTTRVYYDCNVNQNGPWCSTKVDENGNHITGRGNWGNCGSECPMAGMLTEFLRE